MAKNIEIKARAPDLAAIRSKAASLAAGPSQSIEQTDLFFVVPRGRLKVRKFADGTGELISYERADQPEPKESDYTRVACPDAEALGRALGRVLPGRGTVVKRREVLLVGRTRIHLDQVEQLGTFVELEVILAEGERPEDAFREAHALLRALGIAESTLIAGAYIDLLEQQQTTR